MRTSVDTNVFSALWSNEPSAPAVAAMLGESRAAGSLVVCGPVYVELLAHPQAKSEFIDDFLHHTPVFLDFNLDERIWRETALAFRSYAERRRQSGSTPKRLLADFMIGAHALLRSDRLMTMDPSRYEQAFPRLQLMAAS